MTNKKKEWLRIGVFLLIAFVPTYIVGIAMNEKYGFGNWFLSINYAWIVLVVGFTPAIANVLTRLITKEGFSNSYLHLRLKGNIKKYILAAVLPIITGIASGILITAIYGELDFGAIFERTPPMMFVSIILNILSIGAAAAWVTFGEEFGWRAYLYPKLEKLTGTPAACVIGGIIWGLWHAPLTADGHNFGTENWGHPWTSIGLMILFCTGTGIVLMWLTKKTGSIYPAAICHSVINNGGSAIADFFLNGMDYESDFTLEQHFVSFLPCIVVGAIFFVLLCIKGTSKEKEK